MSRLYKKYDELYEIIENEAKIKKTTYEKIKNLLDVMENEIFTIENYIEYLEERVERNEEMYI